MTKQEAHSGKLDFSKIEAEGYTFHIPPDMSWKAPNQSLGLPQPGEFNEEFYEVQPEDSVPYSSLDERDKHREEYRQIVEKLNGGKQFSINICEDDEGMVSANAAYHALVDVDGERLPFPLVELGLGEKFENQPFVKDFRCPLEDFTNWLKGHFGDQFTGIINRG